MFDLNLTQKWVTAVLTDPTTAATDYHDPLANWQRTFMLITLPVTVGAFIVAGIFSLFSDSFTAMSSPGLWLASLIWALAWTFAIAFIFDFLAGTFDGTRNFDAAYAVVALAIVPSSIGTALGPLPWVGVLLSLAASIYSLVLAYRFIPTFLAVPESARVKHFALSIVVAILINLLVSAVIGVQVASSLVEEHTTEISTKNVASGIFGGVERQTEIADSAAKDIFEPPTDGRLSEDQVAGYVRVMERTRELQAELNENLKDKYKDKEPGLSDIFSGVGGVMRIGTAEMEVVKTGGGNWAEHQWIRSQLQTARIQKDLNATIAHNYELYLEFEDRLDNTD
jgi:hypothetical protein